MTVRPGLGFSAVCVFMRSPSSFLIEEKSTRCNQTELNQLVERGFHFDSYRMRPRLGKLAGTDSITRSKLFSPSQLRQYTPWSH
jgi:hypothetical protein